MLQRAIEKLEKESEKDINNNSLMVVVNHLREVITRTPQLAEKILDKDKTVQKAWQEVIKYAKKQATNNTACLSDDEVYSIIDKYYGIENDSSPQSKILSLADML